MSDLTHDQTFARAMGVAPSEPEPDAPPAPSAPAVTGQRDDLPEKFRRNTELAIDTAAKILTLEPNPESNNYGSELRAVAAASSAQINAQLKADEAAISGCGTKMTSLKRSFPA